MLLGTVRHIQFIQLNRKTNFDNNFTPKQNFRRIVVIDLVHLNIANLMSLFVASWCKSRCNVVIRVTDHIVIGLFVCMSLLHVTMMDAATEDVTMLFLFCLCTYFVCFKTEFRAQPSLNLISNSQCRQKFSKCHHQPFWSSAGAEMRFAFTSCPRPQFATIFKQAAQITKTNRQNTNWDGKVLLFFSIFKSGCLRPAASNHTACSACAAELVCRQRGFNHYHFKLVQRIGPHFVFQLLSTRILSTAYIKSCKSPDNAPPLKL